MYLKSIEVHGFKSFANKIVFEFHNGITGIVGPNGSGKSNVADAVRWVLGEQKVKQLRSSSMQDVIFAGTENRKPVSFAYVAITLDNSDHKLPLDYNEVTVARRVYRSGESEYLINGTQCRLKDVNELFYDTGIGKEGYSIIGQGQIDKILSGKPEERRELFDEAAGIVKFKRRKATALKKLEDEQQNLVRVNDILSELERQVGPLERQAEHAKIYLKKKEELKDCDRNLFLIEMDRMNAELRELEQKCGITEHQQKETTQNFEKAKTRYEELEENVAKADERIGELQQRMNETGVSREKLEGQINVLREQIHTAQQNEEHVKSRIEALEADVERQRRSGEEYSSKQAELEEKIRETEQKKATLTVHVRTTVLHILECLFPCCLLLVIEFIQFGSFLVIFSLAAFIFFFSLFFLFGSMFPVANGIIPVVGFIQRFAQAPCYIQLGFNFKGIPFHVSIASTLYGTITQRAHLISLYALFYFGFQAVEYQGVLFFLPVKHQFKDGGFKRLHVIVFLTEIGNEFLPVKRENAIVYIVPVYSVEFSVSGNHRLYIVCHRRSTFVCSFHCQESSSVLLPPVQCSATPISGSPAQPY